MFTKAERICFTLFGLVFLASMVLVVISDESFPFRVQVPLSFAFLDTGALFATWLALVFAVARTGTHEFTL